MLEYSGSWELMVLLARIQILKCCIKVHVKKNIILSVVLEANDDSVSGSGLSGFVLDSSSEDLSFNPARNFGAA